jgi:hypothetical protein
MIKNITKDIDIQPDEEMHRAKYGRKNADLPCCLCTHHPPGTSKC